MGVVKLYDESGLCKQIAGGDEQAFRALFSLYRDKLFAFVVGLVKSADAAEDIIQDVFLKLWEQRESLAGVENPAAYTFILVRNRTMDHLRKVSNDARLQKKTWDAMNRPAAVMPEEIMGRIEAHDTQALINEAFGLLSAQQQKVFLLSRNEGLNHEQIAQHLGISKHTVKNHLTSSLLTIRKHLLKHAVLLKFIILIIKYSKNIH